MVTSIAHAAFMVKDMAKTLDYYCAKLGFKHAFSLADKEGKPWIEYVKVTDNQFIEFFYAKEEMRPAGTFSHLCLAVDDAEKTCAELEAKGVEMTSQPKMGSDGNVQFWSKDPDGVRIEFMQIMPGSKQAEC